MKLRFVSSILIFISAYSPLAIIFAIQDFDLEKHSFTHPDIVWSIICVALISCMVVWFSVGKLKVSTPPVVVTSVSNRSGELVNYAIPYMISFFALDLGNVKLLLSFGFFMVMMYWLTIKSHSIFINPILALIGYNLYGVKYTRDDIEREDFFLIKGERLSVGESCRIIELSEQLFLVTERNPKV